MGENRFDDGRLPPGDLQFSVRRMRISVAVAAGALGGVLAWQGNEALIPGLVVAFGLGGTVLLGKALRSRTALVNIGWSIVGSVCGASVGFWHAMWLVGSDPSRRPTALAEALATEALVAAMVGTLLGWSIGLACEKAWPPAETGRTRIPWFAWMLLLLGALLLVFTLAPSPCAME